MVTRTVNLRAALLACAALTCGPKTAETDTDAGATDAGTSEVGTGANATSTSQPTTSGNEAGTDDSEVTTGPGPMDACALVPEDGDCNAHFERYFFDPSTQRCQPFYWGGCGGVVPFDDLIECQKTCEPSPVLAPVETRHAEAVR